MPASKLFGGQCRLERRLPRCLQTSLGVGDSKRRSGGTRLAASGNGGAAACKNGGARSLARGANARRGHGCMAHALAWGASPRLAGQPAAT
jgi:hypothetical protein